MPISNHIPGPRVDRHATARLLMATELEKLPPDERAIVERFIGRKHMARNVLQDFDQNLDFGERLADKVAEVGGSWGFIIVFMLAIVTWIAVNSLVLHREAFDPYPYILLNLALSCLAALQAPVIMMSQNRQSDSDRVEAKHDYEVNVRAELEILQVHEKINALREIELEKLIKTVNRQDGAIRKLSERLATRGS